MKPICNLLLGIGDSVMTILQKSIMGIDAIITVDNKDGINWGGILLTVLAIAAVVVLWIIPGTQGIAAAITTTAIKAALAFGALAVVTGGGSTAIISAISAEVLDDTVVLPTFAVGPEEIFSGRILLFDANIFSPKDVYVNYNVVDVETDEVLEKKTTYLERWNEELKLDPQNRVEKYFYWEDGEKIGTSINNSSYELRNTIAKWYYIIRNISLIGSMLILLYIGLRILISSIAEEKAKYKQMLADWLVGICLILLLHFIMVFSHNLVENVTKIFNNIVPKGEDIFAIIEPGDKLTEKVKQLETQAGTKYYFEEENQKEIRWPTNMMGRLRGEAQLKDATTDSIGYTLAYIVLVIFTLSFAFTYIKRLLYLLFLTVIAPLVALTYPIDKLHDGKAQAFNMWLKEYIFNLLIQPFHLLLYTIFVTMAFDLAGTNVIYSLVVLGFMMPAEKFLRTMFGFNKASTPGMLGGAAGAAIAMSAVNSLKKLGSGGKNGSGGNGSGGNKDKDEKGKVRTNDKGHSQQDLFDKVANSGDNSGVNSGDNSGGNAGDTPTPTMSLEDERKNLEAERKVLEEFEAEGALSDMSAEDHWSDEDYAAYQQLEEEFYKKEAKLREQEEARALEEERQKQEKINEAENKPEPQPTSSAENNSNRRRFDGKKFKRAAGKSIRRAAGAAGRTALSAVGSSAKDMAKLAIKAPFGIAGGAIGLAAGIASGDPSKAFQNTTMGAGAGLAVGGGLANRVDKTITASAAGFKEQKEQWARDYHGADYDSVMRSKADQEFFKNQQIREQYKQKLGLQGKEEIDKAMNDAIEYRKYGINDNSIIIRAMQADGGTKENRADAKRIAAARLAETSKSEKDLEAHMKRFAKTKGITQQQVDNMERMVRSINNL